MVQNEVSGRFNSKLNKYKENKSKLEKNEEKLLGSIEKILYEPTEPIPIKDDSDIFDAVVAAELRKLSPRNQAIAKNQI